MVDPKNVPPLWAIRLWVWWKRVKNKLRRILTLEGILVIVGLVLYDFSKNIFPESYSTKEIGAVIASVGLAALLLTGFIAGLVVLVRVRRKPKYPNRR